MARGVGGDSAAEAQHGEGWLLAIGTGIEIAGPAHVRQAYCEYVRKTMEKYKEQ